MTAPGTRGLFLVAMVGHEVRCGEGFDGGTPLGGVWHVSARSVHAGLPEEKRLGAVVEKRSIALSRANAESLLQCPVFSNDLGCWTSLLIFGWFSRMLVFEKLVALFARKSNENLGLLRRAMKVGYARVSTRDQHLALQLDALRKAGCRQIYEEVVSRARAERPVLQQTLAHLREGDVLMIWKLDRLGRSLRHLIEVVTDLSQRGIGFQSLQEQLNTTTSTGKLVFHMFGALAEFERDLIRERTRAGLVAARARGRKGGQPKALTPKQAAIAQALYDDKNN